MDTKERDRQLEEKRREMMEGDFNPGYRREALPANDVRMVNAAEYSAYQLGKMNRLLERLIDVLERRND